MKHIGLQDKSTFKSFVDIQEIHEQNPSKISYIKVFETIPTNSQQDWWKDILTIDHEESFGKSSPIEG